MKQYLSILLIPALLMGCYNIGSYTHYVQNDSRTTSAPVPVPEHEHTRSTCSLYVPPVHPPLPEIPLDEIKRVSSKNDKEVQAILASHIKALREYAVNRRREDEVYYKRYLSECANPLK
jgi:hypothetical protein